MPGHQIKIVLCLDNECSMYPSTTKYQVQGPWIPAPVLRLTSRVNTWVKRCVHTQSPSENRSKAPCSGTKWEHCTELKITTVWVSCTHVTRSRPRENRLLLVSTLLWLCCIRRTTHVLSLASIHYHSQLCILCSTQNQCNIHFHALGQVVFPRWLFDRDVKH